jgi:DNA-binding sugar fermentation-stimulating protein
VRGRRTLSFIMNAGYLAPICDRGDKVYVTRSHRVRAKGGEYIMATETGGKVRYVIVNVESATESTWYALIYGWNRRRTSFGKTRVRLSRAKWRPAYRVRAFVYR